jgi:large subunit ribosomal protein LP0
LEQLLQDYRNILIIGVDNVGSNQLAKIRVQLRGKAIIIMGKNTMMRLVIRQQAETNPKLEPLLELIRGNVGLCFTNSDLSEVRNILTAQKVPAAAKSGTMAPTDVFVPPGPTGLDPGQTSFFQALNIATKIGRGAIEIINQVHLIKKGDKVTTSAVALLSKLDIKPFFYGVVVEHVYENGAVYPAHVLELSKDDLMAKFVGGIRKIAALSLAIGYPTPPAVPHALSNGFKKLLALSLATTYSFKELDMMKKAGASGPAKGGDDEKKSDAGGGKEKGGKEKGGDKGGKDKGGDKKKEEPKEEPPAEEEEMAGGFGDLFG